MHVNLPESNSKLFTLKMGGFVGLVTTWNPKSQFFSGCFNWMIPNLYLGNGWKSANIHLKLVV